MKIFFLLFFFLPPLLLKADIYLTVTGANVRRAKIAVSRITPLNPQKSADKKMITFLEEELKSSLEWVNLFEFLPESLFPASELKDIGAMKYEDWEGKSANFVLKLGQKVESGKFFLEAHLFDVFGKKKIFGTRYQYPSAQSFRLVQALAEDILKYLTGEKGLFISRISMVCRQGQGNKSSKEIFVMNADGRGLTRLTFDNSISLSPSWSPDAKHLIYTQYATVPGTRRQGTVLRRHDLASGARTSLSSREGMNSGGTYHPKNNKIAITLSFNGRPEIYLLNPSGNSEPEPLSRLIKIKRIGGEGFQPNFESLLFDVEPSFSPDGNQIVFSSARSGNPMIYTADLATKIANQLTFAGKYNAAPDWSPKGDKILFAAQRVVEGNFDIYIIDPDGNNLNRLTVGDRVSARRVNSENPSWAPTGRHFAFSANEGGNYAVYVMTADGTIKRKISPEGRECSQPSWGPAEN